MPAQGSIPSTNLTANTAQQGNVETYLGQTVEQYCGKYGTVGDSHNHCAHFVSHVLGTRISGAALCSNVDDTKYAYEDRRAGFCVRVNEVFNSCANRAYWSEEPAGSKCLIVLTVKGNVTGTNPLTIGTMANKHIGIYTGGSVYHYSNTRDQVVKQTVAELKNHYGKDTIVLRADLP